MVRLWFGCGEVVVWSWCGHCHGVVGMVGVVKVVEVVRSECPSISPVIWKGVALSRQRSSRTLKTLSKRAVRFCHLQGNCLPFKLRT